VRLLVARPSGVEHHRFADLDRFLGPGDLLVVNTSATLPAAVPARRADGRRVGVHVSTSLDDGAWVVEPRHAEPGHPDGPALDSRAGERLTLPGGVTLTLDQAYPEPDVAVTRLWRAHPDPATAADLYLARHGRPIRYGYLHGRYPLRDYQTVYATEPGSAEMASAGRPFTERLLVRLMARNVAVAPVVLHAGVSSQEKHEPPLPERFRVSATTALLVNATRAAGGRVVAVGTTVTRALESVADPDGTVRPAAGWTDLVLGPGRPARVVTGLVSGLHAPEASHLLLLEAVAGPGLVGAAYREAVRRGGYLWHEFGDSTLLLP
jgi:S-adenosylmethionine:tRNA ribosyltransferase-isomerase